MKSPTDSIPNPIPENLTLSPGLYSLVCTMSDIAERKNRRLFGRIITQEWQTGRLRLDPDVIPELATWLMYYAEPYVQTYDSIKSTPSKLTSPRTESRAREAKAMMQATDTLIAHLLKSAGRKQWDALWHAIAETYGVSSIGFLVDDIYDPNYHYDGSGI